MSGEPLPEVPSTETTAKMGPSTSAAAGRAGETDNGSCSKCKAGDESAEPRLQGGAAN